MISDIKQWTKKWLDLLIFKKLSSLMASCSSQIEGCKLLFYRLLGCFMRENCLIFNFYPSSTFCKTQQKELPLSSSIFFIFQ